MCVRVRDHAKSQKFVNKIPNKLHVGISSKYNLGAVRVRSELIRFRGQKVRGRNMTKYGQKSLVQKCIVLAKAYQLTARH